jgi:Flavin containing amine oxidoreductase
VVGGGASGLTIAHVLQQSGQYQVNVFEAEPSLGGHVRSVKDPLNGEECLNIGHATHMGMFVNLRLMLRHLGVPEWPVGRGPNDEPGLFRMISVTANGETFQPPLEAILSPRVWWDAFWFYFHSYTNPEQRLDNFLATYQSFSQRFLDILYWAVATFEFDKHKEEAGEYALGAARALLITRVFFQYLLCDAFEGSLPNRVDRGLKKDLASRIELRSTILRKEKQHLLEIFEELTSDTPLASYFTSEYVTAVEKLAAGAGNVLTNAAVSRVYKTHNGRHVIEIMNGETMEADYVVFTTHPSIVGRVLDCSDYPKHAAALQRIDSGAVGVRIIHANDLTSSYPPPNDASYFDMNDPPPLLGIFDISQLTTIAGQTQRPKKIREAGWLSVAYPVYRNMTLNRHEQLLEKVPCLDAAVYPWTRATATFPKIRRDIMDLQGRDGIFITGQTLTGVNKASELQITNALNLCYDSFGVLPPWKHFFPCPMLPDCNDDDAFLMTKSPLEAAGLAMKSLVGSFLLTSAVSSLGVKFFN